MGKERWEGVGGAKAKPTRYHPASTGPPVHRRAAPPTPHSGTDRFVVVRNGAKVELGRTTVVDALLKR